VIPIQVPPLRQRTEDIALLARSFFNRLLLKSDKKIDGISQSAMDALMAYSWPGNVRELKSAFEFAFVACPGGMIDDDHLPPQILTKSSAERVPGMGAGESLDDVKRRRLAGALERSGGNQSEAARLLGLSRTSVWKQIKKYNLTVTS